MEIFQFDNSSYLGSVREVDTRKVTIQVNKDEDLRKAYVGHLVAIKQSGAANGWLIAIIEKVTKSVVWENASDTTEEHPDEDQYPEVEKVVNTVRVTLVGTLKWNVHDKQHKFSRSLVNVPEIESSCYILRGRHLEDFMNILSVSSDYNYSLEFGKYTLDEKASAYLDGNKLFQRHAAVLGSTGSGKSWTVASILEQAAELPSANLIVFDLHGEYRSLDYATHLRIPGPDELGQSKAELLYLPYWLLNAEELQAMFIDRSEFSAHNQVMAFQDAVIEQKRAFLEFTGKFEVLSAFTLDSPVPFSIDEVLRKLQFLNEEMEQGARGLKQGKFYGQFSRLLTRMRSKISDNRYGFLFKAPPNEHKYESMALLASKLMSFTGITSKVKVIDFSEVPSDILPVIIGLVARMIYQIQFWTQQEKRHPLAFICDEAHLYLPRKEGQNPVERRAIETFEKIAKEGRKYGVALMIVSQRPADVSTTVLSQCNNVIAMRLTNADDQSTVRKLMPESLEGLLDTLPILDTGEAMVVGDAVLLPSRIRVKPPMKQPLSSTINFWTEWQKDVDDPDFMEAVENMRRQRRLDS
jgi:hypothetical protein